ncbi:MAG TPA: hypothetical protein VF529_07930 [Solirubrobacteraceae bacterium]
MPFAPEDITPVGYVPGTTAHEYGSPTTASGSAACGFRESPRS